MSSDGAPTGARIRPPGGVPLALAKHAAERVLWARVAIRRRVEARLRPGGRSRPAPAPPTDVLRTAAQWRAAVAECRRLRLPLHHDQPKNWDALGALATVLDRVGPQARVLDAGSARYSPVLPWLRLYGLRDLIGINLEFGSQTRRDGVVFQYGDITATQFADRSFDAVTCLSVVEHGVPIGPLLAEMSRILRPGGVLVLSTDYDAEPPDTSGIMMYGHPVHVFGPEEIRRLVDDAGRHGLDLLGPLALEHDERPVRWRRAGLDFTFIRLSFVRR
jgi:SAM-dependent methyltransferase